jgi:protein SCO1/2
VEALEATTLPPGEPAAGSIYDLDSTWRNQDGDEVRLGDLRGKVRVLAMGYSTCKYACPRLVADIRKVQQDLDPALALKVGFAFVSIDPETDTPEQLRAFAARHGFESDDWMLLTGDEDGVLELAVVLGMKYRRTTETDFAHSNIITVLSRDGEILHQQTGLGADQTEILAAIRQAAGS